MEGKQVSKKLQDLPAAIPAQPVGQSRGDENRQLLPTTWLSLGGRAEGRAAPDTEQLLLEEGKPATPKETPRAGWRWSAEQAGLRRRPAIQVGCSFWFLHS